MITMIIIFISEFRLQEELIINVMVITLIEKSACNLGYSAAMNGEQKKSVISVSIS